MSEPFSIPPSWTWATAHELCEKIQDGTHFSPKTQLPEGRYRYITARNVRPTGLDLHEVKFLREEDHRAIYRRCDPRKGDVLLVKDGVNTGDAALNTLDEEISLLSSVCFLRPRSDVLSSSFLRYYLGSPMGLKLLTGRMSGTAIKRIILRRIRETKIPVAPLAEQERMVEAIESLLTRLESAEKALLRAQANLKRYRASVLKAAVEGRLVPTEAELARRERRSYEPASKLLERILAERRRRWEEAELAKMETKGKTPRNDNWKSRYKEPLPPASSELPELPEGWCWTTLDALTAVGPQNGLYLPKSAYGSGTPILRIDDYQDDWSRCADELQKVRAKVNVESQYGLGEGDLVINRVNSPSHLGKSLLVEARHLPSLFESNMMRLRLVSLVDFHYINRYLQSPVGRYLLVQKAKWAVNQASINQGDVLSTAVPLAPLSEQSRVAVEVETQLSLQLSAVEHISLQTVRQQRLRQAILKWAFEGKLVDQDPNDEPASVLLECIRAEREKQAAERPRRGRRPKGRPASSTPKPPEQKKLFG